MGLYAQNWLKIKNSFFFLNFDLSKEGCFSPLSPPPGCALVNVSIANALFLVFSRFCIDFLRNSVFFDGFAKILLFPGQDSSTLFCHDCLGPTIGWYIPLVH